ncbi:MAG TPA: CocE/NonD family hydrolase [Verrucomicrobiaceae bacterium]
MKTVTFILAVLVAAPGFLRSADLNSPPPEAKEIQFNNGSATLHGFIYQPAGDGPFPAVLYNHGSDKKPGWFPELAKFWNSHGFVFFVPHRQGHGRSAGDWIVDLQQQYREKEKDPTAARKHDIELHEKANEDVVAAVAWLRQQPYVNANAIVMSGISYGGIQTVLASEKELGMKAYVPFSPGAMSWAGNPLLRERLLKSLKHATAPVFLLQAKNDYNLGPTELLGAELKHKGPPNRSTLYPAFGKADDPKDGHGGFAVRGSTVWGDDVLKFVNAALAR